MELLKASFFLCLSLLMTDAKIENNHKLKACNLTEISVESLSKIENFDHFDLYALIIVESRWNKNAISSRGACGLTQVLPRYSDYSCQELMNPNISIDAGIKSLQYWLSRTSNDKRYALCGYNQGNSCILAKKRNENHLGLNYADRIISVSKRLRARYEKYEKHFDDLIYNFINLLIKVVVKK